MRRLRTFWRKLKRASAYAYYGFRAGWPDPVPVVFEEPAAAIPDAPVEPPPPPPAPDKHGRFEIRKQLTGGKLCQPLLYAHGGRARDQFLHEKTQDNVAWVEFWMDGNRRDYWERK